DSPLEAGDALGGVAECALELENRSLVASASVVRDKREDGGDDDRGQRDEPDEDECSHARRACDQNPTCNNPNTLRGYSARGAHHSDWRAGEKRGDVFDCFAVIRAVI